ncbi:HAD family hydrolase [Paenibacillus sp. N3/727]|uniref:HAD family hydrolase n=1 Tax=Paenibacillus sp. N3/727 TaxID=2925845 RepID=UPI001F53859D|nr:HAD family hydrolase [Paenibacillus sp. N3/727]UNK19919.1 HAD family hydrolase [Paenibacillus sp. N3/727]
MPLIQVNGHSSPCRGVLFDKDGTLLHFMALWGGWADYVLRFMEERLELMGAGFTVPKEKVLGTLHVSGGAVSDYDVQGPLAMGTAEETSGILAWQLYAAGMPWNEAIIQVNQITKNAMYQIRQHKPAFPMPGLETFLESCRNASLEMAVVTSDTTAAALEHLEWMGIRSYFSVVIGRDQVENGKPHPEMAEKACRMLGLEPGEAVIIGDSNGDMQMARQAGAALAVGLYQGEGEDNHLIDAEVVISDYNEMKVVY